MIGADGEVFCSGDGEVGDDGESSSTSIPVVPDVSRALLAGVEGSWTMNLVMRFRSRRSRAGRSSFGKRMWRVRRFGFRVGERGPDEGCSWCGSGEKMFVMRFRGDGMVADVDIVGDVL